MCPGHTPELDPVDPEVDLHDPRQRAETATGEWTLIGSIALGGIIGAEARYGLGRAGPHVAGQFPWATLIVNGSGCLLLGALMVVLGQVLTPHRLLRPFLGVGVLGGYTTFSTFGVDAVQLLRAHRPLVAGSYVIASVGLGLGAVVAGGRLARAATARRPPR